MSDLLMQWTGSAADLVIADNDLVLDDTLKTAVLLSLFTDRQAHKDDVLPDGPGGDRRGWWGDALNTDTSDRIGSRLWLLARELCTDATLRRAEAYAEEALAWLVTDGVASEVTVRAEYQPERGFLALDIHIVRPSAVAVDYRWDLQWSALAREVA